jgi:3-methylcrotonyl-CoA carboxylase alpha subunit
VVHGSIGGRHDILLGQRRWALTVYASGERVSVFAREGSATVLEVDVIANAGEGAGEGGRLTAPMPGRIVAFLAQPGQAVKLGQPLAVLEAMKMEHTITAPRAGTVAELLYAVGDQVAEGGELLRLSDE